MMGEPRYRLCLACAANGVRTTIFSSNVRAWNTERCFECHKFISGVDQRLDAAMRRRDALFALNQLLGETR